MPPGLTVAHCAFCCSLLLGAGVVNTSVAQSLCPAQWRFRVLQTAPGAEEVLQHLSSLLVTHQPLLNK